MTCPTPLAAMSPAAGWEMHSATQKRSLSAGTRAMAIYYNIDDIVEPRCGEAAKQVSSVRRVFELELNQGYATQHNTYHVCRFWPDWL